MSALLNVFEACQLHSTACGSAIEGLAVLSSVGASTSPLGQSRDVGTSRQKH